MKGEIKKYKENQITCPYCGWEDTDSWESGLDSDGDNTEINCSECEKKFTVTLHIDYSYSSDGLCIENDDEHNWDYFDHTTDGKRCCGRHCLTCDEYEFGEEKLKLQNEADRK
jgi:hypothetical protein